MNIYILEDDIFQQQYLKQLIEKISVQKRFQNVKILATTHPRDILEKITTNVGYNIYFLDIEIKNNYFNDDIDSGFELAKKIREIDSYGWLVFVTTHSEFLKLTMKHKLTALDFIEKGCTELEFRQAIEDCLVLAYRKKGQLVSEDAFIFKNQQVEFQIPFADILYFETTEINHKLRMIAKTRVSEFYATIKEIVKNDHRLFQCSRSCVVNLENIETIDKKNREILFANGSKCVVSRTKLATLLRRLHSM